MRGGVRIDSSLDDIINQSAAGFGRAPRAGVANSSQRNQPYGRPDAGRRAGAMMQQDADQHRALISETLDSSATPANSIKVGGQQDAKEIAARLCEGCRAGDPPALLTIGGPSVNQAVKAIAIARADMLREGFSLSFQPAFRHTDRTKPLIAFYIAQERVGRGGQAVDDVTLTVAASSKIVPVAGAIAGKVRDNLKTSLLAIGVDAVTNAVLAVGNARLFLERDNCDIRVEPEFHKVDKNGQQMNALRLSLTAEAL